MTRTDLSTGTKISLFADDSLLYRVIDNENDAAILQSDLDKLQKWEKTWKMEFHPQKCLVLKVSNKRNLIKFNYHIHNTLLKETDSAKFLGVNIDSKLKWTKHVDQTIYKANNILSFLKRNLNNCPTHIKAQCYNALVRPILEYGCVVWDPHHRSDIDRLEKIQKRAARFATNNYNF